MTDTLPIYHYHPYTGEYMGQGEADPSPMEPGEYLIPAHATPIAPPEPQAGFRRIFRAGAWALVEIEPADREPMHETEPDPEPEAPPAEVTHDDLRADLSRVHDSYCNGTTSHRGVVIAIDVEARINAQGTLDAVKRGVKKLPFQWFAGNESISVESVDDMQGIFDAIFGALDCAYDAKSVVLAKIPGIQAPEDYSVETAYNVALSNV
ncbi:hypothetical protein SAMN05216571_101421 [Onishia taeanensis]|uniref:DUF4376 domain-containing protein n=1 Tax=Onishia taeanensis TaxID=284577 RepID=A0A1G7NFU5_9GAMM|nr:hypothetical protein [Halomonas taeanensis]SDF72965.1 hypothetical protein SAMN05216571_101421 [Halomonas taeanensis]